MNVLELAISKLKKIKVAIEETPAEMVTAANERKKAMLRVGEGMERKLTS